MIPKLKGGSFSKPAKLEKPTIDRFAVGLSHIISDQQDEMSSNPANYLAQTTPTSLITKEGEGKLLPSGTKVFPKRMMIDPSLVKVWEGNTRFGVKESVDDIEPSIRTSGTNHTAVWLRPINDGSKYKFELIYGSRRLQACINSNKKLTADVCETNDRDAFIIMFDENIRCDPSDWLKIESYQYCLDSHVFPNQQALAANYGMSRATMNKLLAVMDLPEFFRKLLKFGSPKASKSKIREFGSVWRLGKGDCGLSQELLTAKLQELVDFRISGGIKIDVQSGLDILNKLFEIEKPEKETIEYNVADGKIKVVIQTSGALTINIPPAVKDKHLQKITQFIENL
jgi:ParB/RepB/Spo0J family partition protein